MLCGWKVDQWKRRMIIAVISCPWLVYSGGGARMSLTSQISICPGVKRTSPLEHCMLGCKNK